MTLMIHPSLLRKAREFGRSVVVNPYAPEHSFAEVDDLDANSFMLTAGMPKTFEELRGTYAMALQLKEIEVNQSAGYVSVTASDRTKLEVRWDRHISSPSIQREVCRMIVARVNRHNSSRIAWRKDANPNA